ncbi:hypothetical protein AVEN_271572-1, partial [Araneus ventricosus]
YIPPIGEVQIPIDVDASLSSSFTLLVFYVREDRETVADTQKIEVEKCFKNKVTFDFASASVQPGTPVAHRITSSPNSLCGIKVVDKSVTLLDSSDQLTKDRIFQLQSGLNPPSYYGSSNFCNSDKSQPGLEPSSGNSKVNPTDSFYSSSYEDSYAAFQEAGFLVISNLVLFSRPCSNGGGGGGYGVPYTAPGKHKFKCRYCIPSAVFYSHLSGKNLNFKITLMEAINRLSAEDFSDIYAKSAEYEFNCSQ